LIRPLNKGQGHSFWYQSISYIRLPIGKSFHIDSKAVFSSVMLVGFGVHRVAVGY